MEQRRRLNSANPRNPPLDSLNTTLPTRSSLFDFEQVALDLHSLLLDAENAKKCVLQENAREEEKWKDRCRRLRDKHRTLLAKNTELRNALSLRQQSAPQEEPEELVNAMSQCVTSTQVGTLKYMNQEMQTSIEEMKEAVEADDELSEKVDMESTQRTQGWKAASSLLPRLRLQLPALPKRLAMPPSSSQTERSCRISDRSLTLLREKEIPPLKTRDFTPVLKSVQRSISRKRRRVKVVYRSTAAKQTLSNSPYARRIRPHAF